MSDDACVDVVDYHATLAHCSELEAERQSLLQIRARVMGAISNISQRFDDEDSQSGDDESEEGDVHVDPAEASGSSDQMPSFGMSCADPTLAEYHQVIAERDALEQQVEELRDALNVVSGAITILAEKSHELSDHLQDVGKASLQNSDDSNNSTSNGYQATTTGEITPTARSQIVSKVPLPLGKSKLDDMSTLRLASIPGVTSGASSSTATPRSDSESRIASARSANLCEA